MKLSCKCHWVPLITLIGLCCFSIHAETVRLNLPAGPRDFLILEARGRLEKITNGTLAAGVVTKLGYPDEIRIAKSNFVLDGEWRRWCYGVTRGEELPLVGIVVLDSNQRVKSVIIPSGRIGSPETASPAESAGTPAVVCKIESISTNTNWAFPELSYIAKISLVNKTTNQTIEIKSEHPSLRHLVHWEICNTNQTIVFACRQWPMRYAASPDRIFKLAPGESRTEDLHIFLSDVDTGIPRPGKYTLRVGFPLSEKEMVWSEKVEFSVTSPPE